MPTLSIARTFTVLNLYDLLANFIPGMAWLIVLLVLFPVDWFALSPTVTPGTFVAAVIVFGYIAGHGIQGLGSWIDKKIREREHDGKDLFTRTMKAMENDGQDSPIEITHIEESFCDLATGQFDLPDDFPKSSKLFLLVLSYLETRPATRTGRFQAIHTFHRSMFAASLLAILSTLISMGIIAAGVVDNSWAAVVLVLLGSGIAAYAFYHGKNKFEMTFLRYVFLDFYQDQKTSSS